MPNGIITAIDAIPKLEHYCAYQDRCHDEVISKLRSFQLSNDDIDAVVVHLINHNFLNEERFARSFARGKHRIKHWGNVRIVNELKARHISQPNIRLALSEISADYDETFEQLATRQWEAIRESNSLKKSKKFCDFMLRKGYESERVYDKVRELQRNLT